MKNLKSYLSILPIMSLILLVSPPSTMAMSPTLVQLENEEALIQVQNQEQHSSNREGIPKHLGNGGTR